MFFNSFEYFFTSLKRNSGETASNISYYIVKRLRRESSYENYFTKPSILYIFPFLLDRPILPSDIINTFYKTSLIDPLLTL